MSDLIHQDGKWYKPITSEYAFSVRKDPYEWMAANRAIEIDHDKEEYEPECQ